MSYLYMLTRQSVTEADLRVLVAAATSPDLGVYGDGRSRERRRVRDLSRQGLFVWLDAHASGWDPGMWGAVLTCPGFNAMWQAKGDRHSPGCGAPWNPDGSCSGCGSLRRLDAEAWDDYVSTLDSEERGGIIGRTRLWCDEHGFLRPSSQWTTDKTCRVSPSSAMHEVITTRIGSPQRR